MGCYKMSERRIIRENNNNRSWINQIGNQFNKVYEGGYVVQDNVVFEDVRVPLDRSKSSAGAPSFEKYTDDGAGSNGLFLWKFSKTTLNQLFFSAQIPHSYKLGTNISPHIHFVVPTLGVANELVRWGLEYTITIGGALIGNSTIIYTTTVTTDGTDTVTTLLADTHYMAVFADIDGSAITTPSAMINCRIFRDAGDALDDYNDVAYGMEFDFHIAINTIGSDGLYTKDMV